ncbi:MAG: DUF2279 domain-containing protein [Flavobacteriales bacterium]|nr:DUF2279 domain-containing protein [Flavobacteriales bacterium]
MRTILLSFIFLCMSSFLFSQHSFFKRREDLSKGRLIGTSVGIGSFWSGSMIGLSQVWYSEVDKEPWHTFDDSRNWLQMDKAGHFYISHKITQFCRDKYVWSGLDNKKSTWIGAGISIGYQTTFEFFDAYSAEWGFSWSDVAANTLGTISYSAQSLVWNEERIIPKFSYSPTPYAKIRPEVLGSNFAESLLKDYNGQTYWLSFSPATFFKDSKIPKWACISVGYSVDGKLKGDAEVYADAASGTIYQSQREFLLSLDIDFSRLPIKRPWLKAIVKQLNYVKIPFPALRLSGGNVDGSLLYF